MRLHLCFVLLLGVLSGCYSTQTSSGADFVSARPGTIDREIAQIAAVEPDLVFPAKIGIARIVNGQLTVASDTEMNAFMKLVDRNRSLGEFVSINPLSAELAQARLGGSAGSASTLERVRYAAAVQHVDYVLVYEVGARSSVHNTPFALADITIIGGAILPTRSVKTSGVAKGLFLDVRNGYPYASIAAQEDLSGLARSFGASNVESRRLQAKAIERVTLKLIPEFEKALLDLSR